MQRFRFEPDSHRARAFDRTMRLSLADSLEHIAEQARGRLAFDVDALRPLIGDMHAGSRYPCTTFTFYADAVEAILQDDLARASEVLERLTLERPLAQPWRVLPMDDPVHAPHQPTYRRYMNSGPGTRFSMLPPPPDLALRFASRLHEAHALMQRAAPALADEFDALVSDVVLVVGDPADQSQFDGGSSYLMWGGLFLNASSHETLVGMVEVMAHECGHMLLYACAADEALVANEDAELFDSPLRRDPRPMDGIFHATFVSARMHWAMSALLASGLLDAASRAAAEQAMREDVHNFWRGHEVVARHGRLTPTGAAVMEAALAAMEPTR